MSDPAVPSLRTLLLRALRERCPRCGVGAVFAGRFEGNARCDVCAWRLERSAGHWIGGTEINMIACFSLCLALAGAGWAATGDLVTGWALGAVVTAALSPAVYRRSRCVFFALDYLIDPEPDDTWGAGDGDGRDDGWGRDGGEPGDPGPRPAPALRLPLESGPPVYAEEPGEPLTLPAPGPNVPAPH